MNVTWRTLVATGVAAALGAGITGVSVARAQSKPVTPMAVISCGGVPLPDPVQCKTWRCSGEVWTLVNKTNGSTCTDGNACTLSDKCTNGKCDGVAAQPGQACSDSNVCTVGDACNAAKTCVPGSPVQTDDGNPCTSDHCDPLGGVWHAALTNQCCTAGAVQPAKPCADGLCACAASAVCAAPGSFTRYCYDRASNMTARQALSTGQACSACP